MTLRRYAHGALLAAGNSYDYLHGHGFSQLTVRTVMVRKDGLGTQFCIEDVERGAELSF